MVFFDAQLIHRGLYKNQENRKALDICVGGYHEIPKQGIDKINQPTEEELEKIKNKNWFLNALPLFD